MAGSAGTDDGLFWDRLTGKQVGRFSVQSRLGAGGVATVYQAYDQVAGRSVALKVLPPNADAAARDRFRREALMAGALRHPHIVPIYQVSASATGLAYIAMELVEGESLSDLLSRRQRLQAEESCNLLAPVAEALAHAHRQGVVHRDVKPSNILLKPVSPGAAHSVQMQSIDHPVVPILTDFGVARYLDAPDLTSVGRTVGTPAYMAPEQCAGSREVDGRADIYALGTVLYRCLSGRPPYSGTATQVMHAQLYEPVLIEDRVLQGLPAEVVDVLRRSLAKRPEDRYADATELAVALRLAAGRGRRDGPAGPGAATVTLEIAEEERTETLAGASVLTGDSSAYFGSVSVLVPRTQSVMGAETVPPQRRTAAGRGVRTKQVAAAGLVLAIALGWTAYGLTRIIPGAMPTESARPLAGPTAEETSAEMSLAMATAEPVETRSPAGAPPAQPSLPVVEAASAENAMTLVAEPVQTPTEPAPTATPSPEFEQPVVATSLPTVDEQIDDTATETPEAPSEGIVVACAGVVDEFFVGTVQGMDAELRSGFACPSSAATTTSAEYMPFDDGVMLRLDESPVIYVYYMRTGEWEQAVARAEGAPSTAEEVGTPPDGQYVPPGLYGEMWMPAQRRTVLGYATAPQAVPFEAIVQTFPGGLLIGNKDDGSVYLLDRAKLRL